MRKTTNINDVAAKAQVSKSAVRAALATTPSSARIAPTTRERILRAARELKYRPNIMARCLNYRKSLLLGFFFSENHWHVATYLIRSIQKACQAHDYSLIIYPSASLAEERLNLKSGIDRGLDGILTMPLITSEGNNSIEYQKIAKEIMPAVQLLVRLCPELPLIGRNYRQIGQEAVKYLTELGHRRIGLITFDNYTDPVQGASNFEHYTGYAEAMTEAGLETAVFPIKSLHSVEENMSVAGENAGKILASSYAPTALITSANSLAFGTIMYLREHGVPVPEKISVIGSGNDFGLPRSIMPPLTFFPIDFDRIGKIAVKKCLGISSETSEKEIYLIQEIREGTTACRAPGNQN